MNAKKNIGRCIHCLKNSQELTRDHILPKSYYPDITFRSGEYWTAPACLNCNSNLGKIEEDFLTRIGLCLNARIDTVSLTSDISQRVLRSLNPMVAKNDRDQKIRQGRAKKIMQSIFRADGSTNGIFPNFGYHQDWKPEEQYGIPIPVDEPEKIGKKIIKGIEYKLEDRFIDDSFNLKVYFCDENTIRDVINLIRKNGQKYVIAEGFEFYRFAPFDRKYCLYEIRIWNKFVIYGTLMKKRWWHLLWDFKFLRYKFFG